MPVIGDKPELNLKAVVFATDFSPCAKNAGLYAARMASCFSAKLLVAHAFTLAQAATEVEIGDRRLSHQRKDLTHLLSNDASLLGANSVEAIPCSWKGSGRCDSRSGGNSFAVHGRPGNSWRWQIERGIIGSVAERICAQCAGRR